MRVCSPSAGSGIFSEVPGLMIRICCNGLKSLIGATGNAGFSVRVVGNEEVKFAAIEFMSFSKNREQEVSIFFSKHPAAPTLNLGGELPISYCPTCGKRIWVE